jgi:hypothetical protein
VSGTQRTLRQDCEVLLGQIDGRLANLRSGHPVARPGRPTWRATSRTAECGGVETELDAAERVADALRRLVTETARASAADLARVRAAVHYFVARGRTRTSSRRYRMVTSGPAGRRNQRRSGRSIGDDVRVVDEILRDLGRGNAAAR